MRTIWKFPLPIEDRVALSMPKDARVLSVASQHGQLCMWASVDPDAQREPRLFYVRGTGHPMGDAEDGVFIGTFMLDGGTFVGHVFGERR